jgi:HPt (histidine-containing phosphotransfer) domain-containing protein
MAMVNQAIHSSLGEDPDFSELVELYVAEMPARIERFKELFRLGQYYELNRLAHQLKGSAGGYGFDEITPAAARVEHAATSEPDLIELEAALCDLLDLCSRVRSGAPSA